MNSPLPDDGRRPHTTAPPQPPHSHLSIAESTTGTRHTLRLDGELDMASVTELYTAISRLALVAREIVLDLSKLTFMDSSGLRMLLGVRTRCERNRCKLVVTSPSPEVRRLMEVTGLAAPMLADGVLRQ
jgi:anti-anti-sigma factor